MWRCPSCGKSVQDNFEVCWNCCTSQDGKSSEDCKQEPVARDDATVKPPIFLWKSGTLDVFDTVDELASLYSPADLAESDFIACDCEGRILLAGRGSEGSAVLACDEQQPPSPDVLRAILRGYLERSGMSAEELDSLPLTELVRRAYLPQEPRTGETQYEVLQYEVLRKLLFVAAGVLPPLLYQFLKWLHR